MKCRFCPSRLPRKAAPTPLPPVSWSRSEKPALQDLLSLRAVPRRDAAGVDIEPYLRQVAVLEGLNPDELMAEAGLVIDKYALLWDQMRADGRLQ